MTDPQQFVAASIEQQAEAVRSDTPGSAIVPPAAGLGVTSVDVDALAAQIQALQARLSDVETERAKAAGNPLADTVKTVQHFLGGHGDPVAVELGNDLAAAVEAAGESGDTSRVAQIADKLDRHLAKNGPYPGENYHYGNARAFVADLPDLIDSFKPTGQPAGVPAGKVVAGSVVG